MSVKIGPKAYSLVACEQTWQGHASCFKKDPVSWKLKSISAVASPH